MTHMRSWLFVPADQPKKIAKAFASAADIVVVDLEDSITLDQKIAARQICIEAIQKLADRPFYIRINCFDAHMLIEDLAVVAALKPAGIILPKCDGMPDVLRLDAHLKVLEAEHNLLQNNIKIVPIISETARAVLNIHSFASGLPCARLAGLTWGAEDLTASVGAQRNRLSTGAYTDVPCLARSLTLLAAAAIGVPAIDAVFPNFKDIQALEVETSDGRLDGFAGKMAIHPAQIEIINNLYTASAQEIVDARAIITAFAAQPHAGVINHNGRMLDKPHLLQAQRVIEAST